MASQIPHFRTSTRGRRFPAGRGWYSYTDGFIIEDAKGQAYGLASNEDDAYKCMEELKDLFPGKKFHINRM